MPRGDLSKLGRLDSLTTISLLMRLCAAVRFAHFEGVIHRDIKPANVLLDDATNPKLTDFDLAWKDDTTGLTQTGGMGSAFYCAPEQIIDASRVDERADVFSLGMVGVYARASSIAVKTYHVQRVPLRKFLPNDDLTTLLEAACAWDPDKRLSSATEMLAKLQDLYISFQTTFAS